MKKIILTSNLFHPNVGGIENSLKSMAIENADKGQEIVIITSNIVDGSDNVESGVTHLKGVKVLRYNVPKRSNKLIKLVGHARHAIKAYRQDMRCPQDVVIARYHWSVIFAYLAGYRNIRYLVPGVVKFQSNKANRSDSLPFKLKLEVFAQKIALRLSRKIFVFSESMKLQIDSLSTGVFVNKVVPGVDGSRFTLTEKKNNEKVTLLIMSRLVTAKGIFFAIEALQFLPPHFQLLIVGSGPDENALKTKAKHLKLDCRVEFLGKQSCPEKFYQISDVFLLPSTYEPFGQTLLEASASGLPTVAFSNELVDTATYGVLGSLAFYAKDLTGQALAEGITRAHQGLLSASGYSESVRQFVVEKYSWKVLFETLIK